MRGLCASGYHCGRMMVRRAFWIGVAVAAGLAAGGVAGAQAQERLSVTTTGVTATTTDRFWVQENPLDAVSTDLLAQDRRFLGGLGYGIILAPPRPGETLDLAGGGNQVSLGNWHFGVDVLQPAGTGRPGSVAQFAMGYGGQLGDGLAFSVGPTVSMGNDGTASLFGSGGSGAGGFLNRFAGDTGVRDYGLRGSATYSLSESWALSGVLGYRRSLGEFGLNTADEQFFSVLGLGYRF